MAAAVLSAPEESLEPQLHRSLQKLRESLLGFRGDLEQLFVVRSRRNASHRKPDDHFLGSKSSRVACPSIEDKPVAPAPLEKVTVGISGIGRCAGDSPAAKGRKREISTAELGGEEVLRERVVEFLASSQQKGPKITCADIQELWVNKLGADTASISVLYTYGVDEAENHMSVWSFLERSRSDCRQFILTRSGDSWRIEQMLSVDSPEEDECEASIRVPHGDIEAPPAGEVPGTAADAAQPSPASKSEGSPSKRKVPPPLADFSVEESELDAGGLGAAEGDADADTLLDSIQHGFEVLDPARTPKAIFQGFATSSGSTPCILRRDFAQFAAMYGGRSPAAHGGEKTFNDLFDELAVPTGGADPDERGVPYDLFCAELCPKKQPDAVLRIRGKRSALVCDLQAAVAALHRNAGSPAMRSRLQGAFGPTFKTSPEDCARAQIGNRPLSEADLEGAVRQLLGASPGAAPDAVAVKALWCELVRGRKGPDRQLAPEEFARLFRDMGGETAPMPSPLGGRVKVKPLDADIIDTSDAVAADAVVAAAMSAPSSADAAAEGSASTLLDAIRFGMAADAREPSEVFDAVSTRTQGPGVSAKALALEDFTSLAAKFGGSHVCGGTKIDNVFADIGVLFERLAVIDTNGRHSVPYDVFVTEICPDRAPDAVARAAKLRNGLLRDLQIAVRLTTRQSQPRIPGLSDDGVVDEATFRRVVHEVMGAPPAASPDPVAVKSLWCFLVRGHQTQRRLTAKELLGILTAAPKSPSERFRAAGHSGSLEFSDGEDSDFDVGHSAPLPDAVIESITPFATPKAPARPVLRAPDAGGLAPTREHSGAERAESKREAMIQKIQQNASNAASYVDLAKDLGEKEIVTVAGCEYNQKELYLKAVRLDPTFAAAYSDLGCILSMEGGRAVLLEGREYTEEALYVRAIELDPQLVLAYENLRDVLEPGKSVTIGGTEYNQKALSRKITELKEEESKEKGAADPDPGEDRDLWGAVATDIAAAAVSLADKEKLHTKLHTDTGGGRDLWGAVAQDIAARAPADCQDSPTSASHISDSHHSPMGASLGIISLSELVSPTGADLVSMQAPTSEPARSSPTAASEAVPSTAKPNSEEAPAPSPCEDAASPPAPAAAPVGGAARGPGRGDAGSDDSSDDGLPLRRPMTDMQRRALGALAGRRDDIDDDMTVRTSKHLRPPEQLP
mmetsp:Transcript_107347/g.303497  ORF Transcript_107347/g.303497 Transcript_107347/m.303497 type:complete len:1194 (+) Transcript_107347:53-3634(+)